MSHLPTAQFGSCHAAHGAVLDTQVVLDWLVFRDKGTAALAQSLERGSLRWLTSQVMIAELEHVLDRDVAAAWRPDRAAISRTCNRLAMRLEVGIAPAQQLRCSDVDDQKFIDLALAVGAQWLFTRDLALLRLARRARESGVIVLKPVDWDPSITPSAGRDGTSPMERGRPQAVSPRP
jgi:predicted nucleic acid-binding protein